MSIDGASDWSVVIRTLVKRGRGMFVSLLRNRYEITHRNLRSLTELRLGAGGAITHLSDPEKEWEEVLTKIDAVLGTRRS